MENLKIYEEVRAVPQDAQKLIKGGRLKGMTDINPMWRIKTLTQQFGPVGIGWWYKITNRWIEDGSCNEKCAFVEIELYVKIAGEWSAPIVGTGGSKLIAKESSGLYTDDEAFKKALTDAISVACKALGIGADVYWEKDKTKYDDSGKNNDVPDNNDNVPDIDHKKSYKELFKKYMVASGQSEEEVRAMCENGLQKSESDFTDDDYIKCCKSFVKKLKELSKE